jgi:hypothetical protein
MRLSMALLACRDLLVACMAISTCNRVVLGLTLAQHGVDIVVTAGTKGIRCGLGIDHLCRLVHRMAGHALCTLHSHCRAVVLMACITCRNVSMFISVAVKTGHVGQMPAGMSIKLLAYLGMALAADSFYVSHGNIQGLVRVCMAGKTRG